MESESKSIVIECLVNTIWHALDQHLLKTAIFTAERLYGLDATNPASVHLVSLVFYRAQQYNKAASFYTNTASDAKTTPLNTEFGNHTNNVAASHLGCLYIYALSCFELKEYSKAIFALERNEYLWENMPTSTDPEASSATGARLILPTAAMIHTLMGQLYKAIEADAKAIRSFALALRLDPLLWEAAEALCHYGVDLQVGNIYKHITLDVLPVDSQAANHEVEQDAFLADKLATSTPSFSFGKHNNSADPFNFYANIPTPTNQNGNGSIPASRPLNVRLKQKPGPSSPSSKSKPIFGLVNDVTQTPSASNLSPDSTPFTTPTDSSRGVASRTFHIQNAPTKRTVRTTTSASLTHPITSTPASASLTPSSLSAMNSSNNNSLDFMPRRSARQAAEAAKKNITTTSSSRFAFSVASSGNGSTAASKKSTFAMGPPTTVPGLKSKSTLSSLTSKSAKSAITSSSISSLQPTTGPIDQHSATIEQQQALAYLVQLYTLFTKACLYFGKYDCATTLSILRELPASQQQTPWVLAKLARIHFEKVEYTKSLEYFLQLRAVDRFRIEDMDYYSTLLWHLHKDYELSHLAYDLSTFARNKYQTWCAIGNACSLQHETDAALRCFRRASQVDPSAPYPYTLQAHEYVANDSYEHAQDSYRLALKADKLHYNAWYGLGMVFLRLGNTNMAELHFRRAAAINPINVVLICCIGMVLEKKGHNEEALSQYTRAAVMQPTSAMSRYKRARLLVKLRHFNEALAELQVLETLATDEASVYFLLGQVYKLVGEKEQAVKAFTVALNLDPKGSQMIEEALESLGYEMNGVNSGGPNMSMQQRMGQGQALAAM